MNDLNNGVVGSACDGGVSVQPDCIGGRHETGWDVSAITPYIIAKDGYSSRSAVTRFPSLSSVIWKTFLRTLF